MLFKLPNLEFELPEWQARDFVKVKKAENKLADIASNGGTTSPVFEESCKRLQSAAKRGNPEALQQAIERPVDVRAFTYLLGFSDGFAEKVSITVPLLKHLLSIRKPLNRLSFIYLVRVFLSRFDKLASGQNLSPLCKFITQHLHTTKLGKGESDLARSAKFSEFIFVPDGPAKVVAYAKSENLDLEVALERMGLTAFYGGRFITLCRYQYYLKTIDSIPVGADDPVLAEIVKPEVVNSPYTEDKLLGHAILEILIDRSAGGLLSLAWQKTILNIAGDPRVPKSHPKYQQWWGFLGDKRISLMRGWLSRFDLKIFLEILEQSAKDGGHRDMERMFGSRKVFMEGLLEQGLISESRLLLGYNAEEYLSTHYKKDDLPEYATVSDRKTSIIYLNLLGKVHLVEGSHNFSLKLFDRLPSKSRVNDYEVKNHRIDDLRSRIITQYGNENSSWDGCYELKHDVHLHWQRSAIDFIKAQGINIDIAKLVGSERHREYKQKFGA